MRLKLFIAATLFCAINIAAYAQSIWTNPITGADPGSVTPYTTGQTVDPNLTVSGIGRGSGLIAALATNNRYSARSWSTGGLSTSDYFEFTLTPSAGYRIDFANFIYTGQSSGTGPISFALRSSTDGYTSNIGAATAGGTTIPLLTSAYQGITTAVTFRLYAWNASAATGTFSINDFTFNGNVNATCTSVPLTSVRPTSGPVGTEVTITAASGLTAASATFDGIPASVVSTTATQLVVTVPAGAATGNLIVKNAALCASTSVPFTVFREDKTTCAGSTIPGELFLSEVTDSNYGSLTYIEIYNGTAAVKNLSTYSLKIASNGGVYTAGNTIALPNLNLAVGVTYVVAIGVDATVCATPGGDGSYADLVAGTGVTSVNFTTNQHDHIGLFNGASLLDSWGTFGAINWAPVAIGAQGATFKRNNNAASLPNPTYNNADWTIVDYAGMGSANCANNDYSDVGAFATFKTTPTVNTHPTVSLNCTTTGVTLSVTGTEGAAMAPGLAYQWYLVAPGAPGIWTVVPNSGIYSGANSASLTISSIATVNNYQFYCRILEDQPTCYIASNAVIIKDTFGTSWTSLAWSNGAPSFTKRVTIDDNYDTATYGSFEACSLTVNAAKTLTINPGNYVSVQNNVTVNATATLSVEDDGSLVQISDSGVNTGNIISKRNASIKKYDYVYWSAPVSGTAVTSISPTTATSFIYKWLPTQGGNYGGWTNTTENMTIGKGYIVRAPTTFTATPQTFSTAFTGVPNNGIITASIERGSYVGPGYTNANGIFVSTNDDNWNLIGNPYPSAIRSLDFLAANANIEGAVRIWTHGAIPSAVVMDPFYGNYVYNYNPNDYIVYNGTGTLSGPSGFLGNIASGQGFFVLMNDGTAATQTVMFNNAMRSSTYANSQFYKHNTIQEKAEAAENRIWLDLIGADGKVNRTLVGYIEGATLAKDRMFDAYSRSSNNQNFYSLIGNEAMAIQGRSAPFQESDQVALGIQLTTAANYTIAIAAVDGLFEGNAQPIYLEDKLTGVVHGLKKAPYSFAGTIGIFDNRFVLRYAIQTLENLEFSNLDPAIQVISENQQIFIKSISEPIEGVTVYDLLGRQLAIENRINKNTFMVQYAFGKQEEVLTVRVVLKTGQIVTKKVIF